MDRIRLEGARQHNLKNLTLEIPRHALTVVTGVSGSGKSSLAFDTLYAEGQRRYMESVSTYARQFLDRLPRPDLDRLEGLSPAVAIQQHNGARSARSTVGTTTEILDYLRLLFARVGAVHCAGCGQIVRPGHPGRIAGEWTSAHPGQRTLVLHPFQSGGRAAWPGEAAALVSAGYLRVFHAREVVSLEPAPALKLRKGEWTWVVVDRLDAGESERGRLVEALQAAYRAGEGRAALAAGEELLEFHESAHCAACDLPVPELTPQLFSFNSPVGACPTCRGYGNTLEFSLDLVVPDPSKSLDEGALAPWAGSWRWRYDHVWRAHLKHLGVRTQVAWLELSEAEQAAALRGDGKKFRGVMGFLDRLKQKGYKPGNRFLVKRYQRGQACLECGGTRLGAVARQVQLGGMTLAGWCALPVRELPALLAGLRLEPEAAAVAAVLLEEVQSRLRYLSQVGLEYLTLDRESRTLSGGEAQRIELGNALGARLSETLYVLDEPTVGLHPRDTVRLLGVLAEIRDRGNTLVVVEHDREVMERADCVLDLGPGAGASGGQVLFQGSLRELLEAPTSSTGRYLAGELAVRPARARRVPGSGWIRMGGITRHNLHGLDVEIPTGMLVCLSGVSGSGKSTLLEEALYPALLETFGEKSESERCWTRAEVDPTLGRVSLLDSSPIGRSSRSNPATYLKAWDPIRELLASQPLARERGYRPGTFSFNVKGGRCESCEGEGEVKVEMFLMADLHLPCEACGGSRFGPATLEVLHRGRSAADLLGLTVEEAVGHFAGHPEITSRLHELRKVGLGYLQLGQSASTLSGGEAQRLKLAREFAGADPTPTIYLLDEPTSGLHPSDVRVLLEALDRLLEKGHSLVVIEHHPEVLAHADWVLDLGPEGGPGGGRVVAQGPPEVVAAHRESHTAPFLLRALRGANRASRKAT